MSDIMFGGLQIIQSDKMLDGPFEDWSDVRSPSRAKRRRAHGHRQNIRTFYTPSKKAIKMPDGSVLVHPAMAAELFARVQTNQC